MPEDSRTDDVEKVLSDLKSIEDRKQSLIADLLKQRDAAIKDFDEKLAKLGHQAPNSSGRKKRNHHKPAATPSGDAPAQPKGKAKA